MKVIVTSEHRFLMLQDGSVWTPSTGAYSFWVRYLEVFDTVQILSRAKLVERVPADWLRVDGESVELARVPYYHGLTSYLRNRRQVREATESCLRSGEAIILRAPSNIANVADPWLRDRRYPYGVEVVGDPWDVFARGVVDHPLRPFLRRWLASRLRRQCRDACAAAYVTKESLQRRYPARTQSSNEEPHVFAVSDVQLTEKDFRCRAEDVPRADGLVRLITVGSLEQPYKGVDVLIRAVRACRLRGHKLTLSIVGEGKYRQSLEELASQLHLREHVQFVGQLPGFEAVAAALDQADLFVLASRTEGLPRALLEAMARGLPCIGSAVGGIPELLSADCLVVSGDALGLANRIIQLITNPTRLRELSQRNIETAREYTEDRLREGRVQFLRRVQSITENWRSSGVNLISV